MSCRTKVEKATMAVEAMRRTELKFQGRMKIHVSNKFGFTILQKADYTKLMALGRRIPDDIGMKSNPSRGPLHRRFDMQCEGDRLSFAVDCRLACEALSIGHMRRRPVSSLVKC